MWEITEKYLMQVAKHIFIHRFVWCYLRVSIILLCKLKFLCFQPSFNLCLCWIPWPEHSFLYLDFSHASFTDLVHSIPCSSSRQQNHLLVINLSLSNWADPGSNLNKFPTKPSKTIIPPGKLEGNTVHKVHSTVSPKIVLWVTTNIKCLQSKKDWGYGIYLFFFRPSFDYSLYYS
jgi:hypothetical protein